MHMPPDDPTSTSSYFGDIPPLAVFFTKQTVSATVSITAV